MLLARYKINWGDHKMKLVKLQYKLIELAPSSSLGFHLLILTYVCT